MTQKNMLQKKLEDERFARAIIYVEQTAGGLKRLNSTELAHLNQMLTGQNEDPWRFDAASVQIPSGKIHQMSVVANPIHTARDILDIATQSADQDLVESAFQIYSRLILKHLFKDANRRTAALATYWFVRAKGGDLDVKTLAQTSVGDLREPSDLAKLKKQLEALIH